MSWPALDLEEIDTDIYRSKSENLWRPPRARGVFGGQVVGQSLVAATRTVPDSHIVHSLHSYFLLPGNSEADIIFYVRRLHDGKAFVSRHVVAMQKGRPIFSCQASFHKTEISRLEHQLQMPEAPPPDSLLSDIEKMQERLRKPDLPATTRAMIGFAIRQPIGIEIRHCPWDVMPTLGNPFRRLAWMRATERIPSDMAYHCCVAAFATDVQLLMTAALPMIHSGELRPAMMASLDHSMWFHSPFRADEWMLYEMESPRATGGKGLCFGRLWNPQTRQCAITVSQEGVIRWKSNPTVGPNPNPPDSETDTKGEIPDRISKL